MDHNVTMTVAGARVTLPVETLTKLWLDEVQRLAGQTTMASTGGPPRIGSIWHGQGGVYAGDVRGDDGDPDYHLIVAEDERTSIDWTAAGAWASSIEADGHRDFTLPKRKDQSILFGNVPELFAKEAYWSGVEHAENAQYAWCQGFNTGYQDGYRKGASVRARDVRRVPIRLI